MIEIVANRMKKIKRKQEQEDFINKMKDKVKKEESFLDVCKEYDVSPDFIDDVSVSFDDDLDVSAKTVNGDIILNGKLFDKGDFVENVRYLVHEATHVLQQENNEVRETPDGGDYLDDENEQAAFQAQIQYMNDHVPQEEVQEYLEHLLDHHGITNRKERMEKIKKLTEKL